MPAPYLTDKLEFPPVDNSFEGIVAFGGDLSTDRLLLAYSLGIFPWYSSEDPITWWNPERRFVLFPSQIHVSRSMEQVQRSNKFEITYNQDFRSVIRYCRSVPRNGQEGTWITPEMEEAYIHLHELGHAHSVETWQEGTLVGGLYGVLVGSCFCGESMFSLEDNASKMALISMTHDMHSKGLSLIDCQVYTDHLASMGAVDISREAFLEKLESAKKTVLPFETTRG